MVQNGHKKCPPPTQRKRGNNGTGKSRVAVSSTPKTERKSLQELDRAIQELDTQKAPREDGIHAEFLKNSGPLFRRQLLSVINKTWKCQIPKEWKLGLITPVLKKDKDANQTSSYRPIALTSVLAKTAERMVANRLTTFLEEKQIICPQQKQPTERTGPPSIN
jgi:hypothetical protein